MNELKKVYLYHEEEEETKPIVNDSDLQIEMSEKKEIREGFDFRSIYHKYLHDDTLTFDETVEPKKTLRELDGAYKSLREIHDQLSEVYHELIQDKD
ncbi:MAG: hypothetical protein ACSNEK_04160 [Parachlamydiaceae bacterium]